MRILQHILKTSILLSCWIVTASASPSSDLGAPSQVVRDAAAKIVRETFSPPPRTNWNSLIAAFKIDMPKTNVLKLLGASTNRLEGGGGSGNTEFERYRLDDLWLVECSYRSTISNKFLIHWELIEQILDVWVEPPAKFAGVWTTYYANGQRSHEIHYKDSHYDGEFVAFYSDGSKAYIQHYTGEVAEGEDIGFYPSGRTKYKGQYKADHQVGRWIWYKEDGSIESQKDYGSK